MLRSGSQSRDPRRVLVLLNPAADSGRVAAVADRVERAFSTRFEHVVLRRTEGRGHARRLAEHAGGYDLIVAAGGDGTVHEVALGLVDHGIGKPLGVVPLGTGNDFARMLGMPREPDRAAEAVVRGSEVSVDTGCVSWMEGDVRHRRGFVNATGIGFTALTAHVAGRYKSWPLGLGYTAAALDALRRWISAGVTIRDLEQPDDILFSGRLMFVTVGNARDSGGGYSLTPSARLSDGFLDACIVEHMPAFRAVMLMPAARRGSHVRHRSVVYRLVRRLWINTDRGLPVHADGEVVTLGGRDIRAEIRPDSLAVIISDAGRKFL